MSAYQTDPRVDEYIAALPAWQQDIARQVRDVVHAADSVLSFLPHIPYTTSPRIYAASCKCPLL